MMNLIKNEVFKVFKLKKLYIFMAISIVMEVITAIEYIVLRKLPVEKLGPEIKKLIENLNGQSFPLHMLNSMAQMVIIFMAILLADIISDEYKNGTLKLSLLRPVSRVELLNSKIAALIVSMIVLVFVMLIGNYIVGTAFFGWGDKTIVNGVDFATGTGILITLKSYLISLLPYLGFGMIIVFFSVLLTSMGATIGISLGLMLVLAILESIKQVNNYSILHQTGLYMNFIQDFKWENIFIGLANIAVYIVVFYIGSVMVLKKKDILS
jgi:ABC-2 type transport system permease protein